VTTTGDATRGPVAVGADAAVAVGAGTAVAVGTGAAVAEGRLGAAFGASAAWATANRAGRMTRTATASATARVLLGLSTMLPRPG
jgi:hypothetical protein